MNLSKDDIIREEILTSSQALFHRYGFQKTTMEDIAKSVGKSKSTLYYYYKSKEEVFEFVIRKEAKEVLANITAEMQKKETAEDRLVCYLTVLFSTLTEKLNFYTAIKEELFDINSVKSQYPFLHSVFSDFEHTEMDTLSDIFLMGMKNGEFSISEDQIKTLSYLLINSLRGIILGLMFDKEMEMVCENNKVEGLAKIFIKGLK